VRKVIAMFLSVAIMLLLSACTSKRSAPKMLSKEGIAPYELSKSDIYLLQSLGLDLNTNIISFKAPQNTKSLKVNVYLLKDNGTWDATGGGQVSLGQEAGLEGTFAIMLKDNFAINFCINTKGRSLYKTDKLDVDYEVVASSKVFLSEFQKIELNKEIPVAIMIYDSGNSMGSYSTEDFFSPSKFEEMDLVQAVTLIFADGAD